MRSALEMNRALDLDGEAFVGRAICEFVEELKSQACPLPGEGGVQRESEGIDGVASFRVSESELRSGFRGHLSRLVSGKSELEFAVCVRNERH